MNDYDPMDHNINKDKAYEVFNTIYAGVICIGLLTLMIFY